MTKHLPNKYLSYSITIIYIINRHGSQRVVSSSVTPVSALRALCVKNRIH